MFYFYAPFCLLTKNLIYYSIMFSNGIAYILEKKDNFQSDPSALLSILRNEGIDVSSRAPSSLQSRPYSYQVSSFESQQCKQKNT